MEHVHGIIIARMDSQHLLLYDRNVSSLMQHVLETESTSKGSPIIFLEKISGHVRCFLIVF
jgi:hypothetical protein